MAASSWPRCCPAVERRDLDPAVFWAHGGDCRLLGAMVLAAWFLVVDLLNGRALATPTFPRRRCSRTGCGETVQSVIPSLGRRSCSPSARARVRHHRRDRRGSSCMFDLVHSKAFTIVLLFGASAAFAGIGVIFAAVGSDASRSSTPSSRTCSRRRYGLVTSVCALGAPDRKFDERPDTIVNIHARKWRSSSSYPLPTRRSIRRPGVVLTERASAAHVRLPSGSSSRSAPAVSYFSPRFTSSTLHRRTSRERSCALFAIRAESLTGASITPRRKPTRRTARGRACVQEQLLQRAG